MMRRATATSSTPPTLDGSQLTVLWHGWLKKLGRFSKRWRRRYFVFVSLANGTKELRHYDAQKDVAFLLASTPKGIIALTDATGICCFLPRSPSATGSTRKPNVFSRLEPGEHNATAAAGADAMDQKFAVLTPLHVHMLAFNNGKEWGSESQQGLSLLASLSAFYPAVEVLHSGFMSKKRERTGHSASSIISYWKKHFFMFLSSGDLLYFRDESLSEIQGRVDVRHAPTVRVTGERMLEEKRKELGNSVLRFAKLPTSAEREDCLVWIAVPPSKVFVIKVQDEHTTAKDSGKGQPELTPSARKWLSLLLQGHAETKYTQLEQCITSGKYEATNEVVSAVRTGIPDELRGPLWKGFSGSTELQRRAELKNSLQKSSKTTSIRRFSAASSAASTQIAVMDMLGSPIDAKLRNTAEGQMITARLAAIAVREAETATLHEGEMQLLMQRGKSISNASSIADRHSFLVPDREDVHIQDGGEDGGNLSDSDVVPAPAPGKRNSLKQIGKGRMGQYVYPNEAPSPEWEIAARRRLLIAISRYNPYSHPCPWRVSCLLLAYLDEESAFWVMNSVLDTYMPGYFHGYRPTLQIDVAAFESLLEDRARALHVHLQAIDFPLGHVVERWFLSLFTSTAIPLPTVLRIWDAFFAQGIRVFFGIGIALFLRSEEKLFQTKTAEEAVESLRTTERGCIDADALFSHVFKDDLNIPWLSDDNFEKLRSSHRQQVLESATANVQHFKEKLGILSQLQDQWSRSSTSLQRLHDALNPSVAVHSTFDGPHLGLSSPNHASPKESPRSSPLLSSAHEYFDLASAAITSLVAELKTRQAKWLALSSQLAGCPLGNGSKSADLLSWASQVREGKISGAGVDGVLHTTRDHTQGFQLKDVGQIATSTAAAELFLEDVVDSSDIDGSEGPGTKPRAGLHSICSWSCLTSNRDDFNMPTPAMTVELLHSLVSAIKMLFAVRMECAAITLKCEWRTGRWLSYDVEICTPFTVAFPSVPGFCTNDPISSVSRSRLSASQGSGQRSFRRSSSTAAKHQYSPPTRSPTEKDANQQRTVDDLEVGRVQQGSPQRQRTNKYSFKKSPSFSHPDMFLHQLPKVEETAPVLSVGAPASPYTYPGGHGIALNRAKLDPSSPSFLLQQPFQPEHIDPELQLQVNSLASLARQIERLLAAASGTLMNCFGRLVQLELSVKDVSQDFESSPASSRMISTKNCSLSKSRSSGLNCCSS
ncbi:hypothetical protein PINS_up013112 [Pythium insidiosum]|nr:hypothetical protein PINS_up013112 [Pythium insidiosum]